MRLLAELLLVALCMWVPHVGPWRNAKTQNSNAFNNACVLQDTASQAATCDLTLSIVALSNCIIVCAVLPVVQLVERANKWSSELGVQDSVHFLFTNVSVSLAGNHAAGGSRRQHTSIIPAVQAPVHCVTVCL